MDVRGGTKVPVNGAVPGRARIYVCDPRSVHPPMCLVCSGAKLGPGTLLVMRPGDHRIRRVPNQGINVKLTREQRLELLLRRICDDETHSREYACARSGQHACGRCIAMDEARKLLAPKGKRHRRG
jgi:hypothetical protein